MATLEEGIKKSIIRKMLMSHKSSFSVLFVIISVLLHVVILWLFGKNKLVRLPLPSDIKIIAASLIIAPLQPVAVVVPKLKPAIKHDRVELTPKTSALVKPDSSEPKELITEQNQQLTKPTVKQHLPKNQAHKLTVAQLYEASRHAIANQQSRLNYQSNLALQQQQYGRKGSLSELVTKPPSHQYVWSEMTVEQRRKVKVYCDSTTKKIAVALSGLLKGSLECEPRPDLQSFIDNRRQRRR